MVNRRSFGVKLWTYFLLFSIIILASLWLLQTVFLQSFYDYMVIRSVEKTADIIGEMVASEGMGEISEELEDKLDGIAADNSVLLILTDKEGNILYSADEHSRLYRKDIRLAEGRGDGVWRREEVPGREPGPWEEARGTSEKEDDTRRLFRLPFDYGFFLENLEESPEKTTGYRIHGKTAYVYGKIISSQEPGRILYISTSLEAVGPAVSILRTQLMWVTAAALLLSVAAAFFISRRFAGPVASLSAQAKHMAGGKMDVNFKKGFCSELDEVADQLGRTADQLARTEKFRQEFLANISHDLRTPLTMIRGYAEAVRDFSWNEDGQREKDLTVIIRESDRLTALVNDILEYTSLQQGKKKGEFEAVNMEAVAKSVIAGFEPLCQKEGFSIELQSDSQAAARGDKGQLTRVLYNLLDNAVSHSGENKKVQIRIYNKENFVRTEVRDYGKGISKEELPYIWERYFTFGQKKRNAKGSGLGLAISKEILLLHGAKFGADSQVGQGSLFWFEVEGYRARPQSAPAAKEKGKRGNEL